MSPSAAVPIDPSLATWDADDPHLIGGRCEDCTTVTFPRIDGCPQCGGDAIVEVPLSRRGTLWTWTTQGFPPKSPYVGTATAETFAPFLLGYVELPEGVMVEGWLLDTDVDDVAIGQAMELTTFELATTDHRGAVTTFAFRPVTGVSS